MPGEEGEVRISLVADDKASAEADKVSEHVKEAGDAASFLREHWAAVAATAAIVTVSVAGAYEFTSKFADAALEAADHVVQQERAMTGLLGMLDQGQHSMGQVADFAHEMREEIEMAGIRSGTSAEQMNQAFNSVIERGGMSAKHAEELTEKMALVGKTSLGGLEGLSSGFTMMELGMTRARNPIVQLIASTQTLHGNAQAVAHQLEKMTQGQRIEVAEKAIEARANVLRQGGVGESLQTLGEARESFSGFREMLFDAMGGPIHNELLPALNEAQQWLMSHADELKDYARSIGEWIGGFVQYGRDAVMGIYEGIKENWAYLQDVVDNFNAAWKAAGITSGSIKEDFKTMTEWLIKAVDAMAFTVKAVVGGLEDAHDFATGKAIGTSRAEDQLGEVRKLADSYGTSTTDSAQAQRDFEAARQHYIGLAEAAGMTSQEIENALAPWSKMQESIMSSGDALRGIVQRGDFDRFGKDISASMKAHSQASLEYEARLILGSEQAQHAFVEGGLKIDKGVDEFIKLLSSTSPEMADKLKHLLDTGGKGPIEDLGGKGGAYYDFRGSQFTQDFKDVDPDRIALVFRRDLQRTAAARTQSRYGMAFGL